MSKEEIMAILDRMDISEIKKFELTYKNYNGDNKLKTINFEG